MINLIVFDLDNTLYREADYLKNVLLEFSEYLDILIQNLTSDDIEQKINRRKKNVLKNLIDEFIGKKYSSIYNLNKIFKIYKYSQRKIFLYKDASEILPKLRNLGIKVSILTNGIEQVQKNKLALLNLEKMVDYVKIVEGENSKPNNVAFLSLMNGFGVTEKETMMIGDDPINDIVGARNIGIYTFRLKRGFFKKVFSNADYESKTLRDIAKLIGGNYKNGRIRCL